MLSLEYPDHHCHHPHHLKIDHYYIFVLKRNHYTGTTLNLNKSLLFTVKTLTIYVLANPFMAVAPYHALCIGLFCS